MALNPRDAKHALQIQAGTIGRKKGHDYEAELAEKINVLDTGRKRNDVDSYLIYGNPANQLIDKALSFLNWDEFDRVEAIALGALATAEEGKKWLKVHDIPVRASKSDILISLYKDKLVETVGVSVKQCNAKTPTNAQLYFTTARAFCELLRGNEIDVSETAETSLRKFCGDTGFKPVDLEQNIEERKIDTRRYFWEEIGTEGKSELEETFKSKQDKITRLLLQKAYLEDPYTPDLVLHKTKKTPKGKQPEFALYSVDELVNLSSMYSGFETKLYRVNKGSFKDPEGVTHEAPRFGIIQMQRGGQKQHPTQLQFNLQAGYFYKI